MTRRSRAMFAVAMCPLLLCLAQCTSGTRPDRCMATTNESDSVSTVASSRYEDLGGHLKTAWSRGCIRAEHNRANTGLVTADHTVVVLGYVTNQPSIRVAGYEAGTGEVLWGGFPSASALASYNGAVYIGTRLGQAQKLNPTTGSVEWSRLLFPLGIVTSVHAGDQGLIVVGRGDSSQMIRLDTGERLATPDMVGAMPVLNIDHSSVYIDSLKSVSIVDGRIRWTVSFSEGVREAPVFLPESILIRTGEQSGRVYCVDRNTGTLCWASPRQAVSNISVAGGWVYFLEEGGLLVRLDAESGEEEILGRFEGAPFMLPSSVGMPAGGYYISAADDLGIVFLLLGDSEELIALVPSG